MVGASLNFQTFRNEEVAAYRENVDNLIWTKYTSYYNEDLGYYVDLDNFTYTSRLNLTGTSVNGKIGVIVKPINEIRLGFAFHTPNYYNISQEYQTEMNAVYTEGDRSNSKTDWSTFDYSFRTPYKVISSLGVVLGNKGFISVDYEFMDYSKAKFMLDTDNFQYDDMYNALNDGIKQHFKSVSNVRVGAEFKVSDFLMARAGFGMYGSPYKKEYIGTDMKRNTYSAGLGYRTNTFFADFAYMMLTQKQSRYLYNNDVMTDAYMPTVQTAQITSANHQITATIGWKF